MRDYMTIIRTVGGNVTRLKQLCTSPTHFRNILSDELLRFAADPSARFIYEEIPLQNVGFTIADYQRCSETGKLFTPRPGTYRPIA